jgi:uncharacterized protein
VHCGDLIGPEVLAACAAIPCRFVFGNHDADNVPTLRQTADRVGAVCLGWGGVVSLGGKRVAVTHGHLTVDVRRVLAERPDFLLTGHSHISGDSMVGPSRRINPGALHEADEFTVAVLDLESGGLRWLRVPG